MMNVEAQVKRLNDVEDDAEEKHKVKGRVDDDEDCVLIYVAMDNEVKV